MLATDAPHQLRKNQYDVRAARLRQSPRYFGQLVPDLVVEIKSQSDRIKPLEKKIKNFIELGAQVGILIGPDEEQEGEPIVLGNEDILTVTELFPGWELPISELWPPIFTLSRNSSIISHFNTIS